MSLSFQPVLWTEALTSDSFVVPSQGCLYRTAAPNLLAGGDGGDGSGGNASDVERWGAANEASLTCPRLTSCCAAWFLTGRGPLPVHVPGVGDPWYRKQTWKIRCASRGKGRYGYSLGRKRCLLPEQRTSMLIPRYKRFEVLRLRVPQL